MTQGTGIPSSINSSDRKSSRAESGQRLNYVTVDFSKPSTLPQAFLDSEVVLIASNSCALLASISAQPYRSTADDEETKINTPYCSTYRAFCAILTACKIAKTKRVIYLSPAYCRNPSEQLELQKLNAAVVPYVALENQVITLIETQTVPWTILYVPCTVDEIADRYIYALLNTTVVGSLWLYEEQLNEPLSVIDGSSIVKLIPSILANDQFINSKVLISNKDQKHLVTLGGVIANTENIGAKYGLRTRTIRIQPARITSVFKQITKFWKFTWPLAAQLIPPARQNFNYSASNYSSSRRSPAEVPEQRSTSSRRRLHNHIIFSEKADLNQKRYLPLRMMGDELTFLLSQRRLPTTRG